MDPSATSTSAAADGMTITRRVAIQRTAMILGAAISPSFLAGLLRAQSAAANAASKSSYLTPKQFEIAGAIAERIIPKTNTPGAREVGVPAFIDLMYGEYMTEDEKRLFVAGLAEVDAAAQATQRRGFAGLSPDEQDALLRRLATASQNKEKSFFHQVKELTLLGYFTSEPVGRNVLHYDPIPGRYDGCIPISEVGNVSWTR